MEKLADIGVYGIGVMGRSIALNFADNGGYTVALYNRTLSKVDKLLNSKDAEGFDFIRTESVTEFVKSLTTPRKIFLMVPAGDLVDVSLNALLPLLDDDDIIIDGGNSFYKDTIRREKELNKNRINFFGVGVSGGEEGARNGPSIMPGGSKEAYPLIKECLERISAKFDGEPCCAHIGEDGAGHYVKMVHNGIEYADMQLIAEAYFILKNYLKLSYAEMSKIFSEWNKRELGGFLIEITADILNKVDPETSEPMLDIILDRAGQKGTGKWTAQSALDLGVAAPTIAQAVFARCSSSERHERLTAAEVFPAPDVVFEGSKEDMLEAVYDSLLASKIVSYAQGFKVLDKAAEEFGWNLNYIEISSIWRSGCIIRAKMLSDISNAYKNNSKLSSMLLAPEFSSVIKRCESNWRLVVSETTKVGIPLPALSSALAYYESFRSTRLWTDMIQAQRDYFGAHTFERTDKAEGEFFHADWS